MLTNKIMKKRNALLTAAAVVAGGVGVHETALASPEVTDLGPRVAGLHRPHDSIVARFSLGCVQELTHWKIDRCHHHFGFLNAVPATTEPDEILI